MRATDATGGCILSRSVVSEVTERLWQAVFAVGDPAI